MSLEEIAVYIHELMLKYGYSGVFLSSFLTHLVPFIALPYLAVIWTLVAASPQLNPLVIGLMGGLGAGVGKLSSYYIGVGGAKVLGRDVRKELEALRDLLKDRIGLIVFLASSTPIPDDIVLIPVGMTRYTLWKYLVFTIMGKTTLCSSVAISSAAFIKAFEWILGAGAGLTSTLISILIMLIFTYAILKIDWLTVASEVRRRGWRGLMEKVRREGVGSILRKRAR